MQHFFRHFCLVFDPISVCPISVFQCISNEREQIPNQICNLLFMSRDYTLRVMVELIYYNLINNFLIIACDARRARSCAAAYILTGTQHTLRAGIVRDDRELFHQIIVSYFFAHGHSS